MDDQTIPERSELGGRARHGLRGWSLHERVGRRVERRAHEIVRRRVPDVVVDGRIEAPELHQVGSAQARRLRWWLCGEGDGSKLG
jgi:hypothetical protein